MEAGIPGMVLMERAGEALFHAVRRDVAPTAPVAVLVGGGNNGGDGYVVARRLAEAGQPVTVVAAGDPDALGGDAAEACRRWRAGGGTELDPDAVSLRGYALLVDALLGTGLDRPVAEPYHGLIIHAARSGVPVLAADLPSGLDADRGQIQGTVLPARRTITFGGLKRGLFTSDGPDMAGARVLEDLNIPVTVRAQAAPDGQLVTARGVALHPRRLNSHKGNFGRVGIIGGAPGMAGAAALAGRAALRGGAGWVAAAVAAPERSVAAAFQAEMITAEWGSGGTLPDRLAEGMDAFAVGPGLGQAEPAPALLAAALDRPVPIVVDADALNLLAAAPELASRVRQRSAPTVLTPHPGEAARLLASDIATVQADRFAAAARLAEDWASLVVLKGAGTVIARPDGSYAVNASGGPLLAMAGQGDVLTGALAARLAQDGDHFRAVQRAVWAHGAAGDRLARSRGPFGVLAGECADELPAVWAELTADLTEQMPTGSPYADSP